MPLPQIIIEDPEGEVQCSECCKKSGEIKKLKENIEEVKTLTFVNFFSTTFRLNRSSSFAITYHRKKKHFSAFVTLRNYRFLEKIRRRRSLMRTAAPIL